MKLQRSPFSEVPRVEISQVRWRSDIRHAQGRLVPQPFACGQRPGPADIRFRRAKRQRPRGPRRLSRRPLGRAPRPTRARRGSVMKPLFDHRRRRQGHAAPFQFEVNFARAGKLERRIDPANSGRPHHATGPMKPETSSVFMPLDRRATVTSLCPGAPKNLSQSARKSSFELPDRVW